MCDFCSTWQVWGLCVVIHLSGPFWEMEMSVNLMSALLQSKTKAETGCAQARAGESIVCPSVFISCWDQVHLSCGIWNETLVSVSDVSARSSCWFVQQTWVQKRWAEKQKVKVSIRKSDFTVHFNVLAFKFQVFFSWILVQGLYLPSQVLVRKCCHPVQTVKP